VLPALAADPAARELVFKKRCFVCHAVGPSAANKQGPKLNGLFGRPAGGVAVARPSHHMRAEALREK
jgi:cytochrome c